MSAVYDRMCAAINSAHELDEAAGIKDPVLRLAVYVRQARNTSAERQASEVRLHAEWCHGVLLRDAAGLPPRTKKAREFLANWSAT